MAATPQVRLVTAADLPAVVELSTRARASAAATALPDDDEGVIARHLSVYLSSGGRIYVAELDGVIGGYVLCRVVDPLYFATELSVVIDAVFVAPEMRRRGLGHGLMSAVAALAAVVGAPYIYSSPPMADRGMLRFLARLSFAPAAGHRIASTAVLLRKLGREDPITQGIQIRARAQRPNRVSIDEVIAKRKRARNAGATGEQPTIITTTVS